VTIRKKPRSEKKKGEAAPKHGKAPTTRVADIEKFRQSEHVGRLLSNGHRVFERIASGKFRDMGFSDLRLTHLALIRNLPVEGRRTTEIAELSDMTKQAVGQLAIELEGAGYVVRLPDPSDGRAKLVKYTKRGHELVARIPHILLETEAEIEALIGKAEFQALRHSLKKLAKRAELSRSDDAILAEH
jgi:DNA-binding MarR family transcriptional regulator